MDTIIPATEMRSVGRAETITVVVCPSISTPLPSTRTSLTSGFAAIVAASRLASPSSARSARPALAGRPSWKRLAASEWLTTKAGLKIWPRVTFVTVTMYRCMLGGVAGASVEKVRAPVSARAAAPRESERVRSLEVGVMGSFMRVRGRRAGKRDLRSLVPGPPRFLTRRSRAGGEWLTPAGG